MLRNPKRWAADMATDQWRFCGGAYLNRRYVTGSVGRSQCNPASAITEIRLAATITANAIAVGAVKRSAIGFSSSQAQAISMTPLAAIWARNAIKHQV